MGPELIGQLLGDRRGARFENRWSTPLIFQ